MWVYNQEFGVLGRKKFVCNQRLQGTNENCEEIFEKPREAGLLHEDFFYQKEAEEVDYHSKHTAF